METTETITDVAVIEQPELIELKNSSQLPATKAENILVKYAPFFSQMADIKKDASKIDFENPSDLDSKIARELRLRLVKVRTSAEDVKKKSKEGLLIEGRLIDSANGIIKNSCQMLENSYEEVEKFVEIRETKRIATLKEERTKILSELISNPEIYPLGEISEESFQDLVNGFKLAREQKIAAEKKVAEELIAKQKAEAEERERVRVENERLKAEAIERESALAKEREDAARAKAKADAEARAERDRHDALMKAERDRVAKEKADADAKLKKEQESKAKVEAELKAKADAEKKAELLRKEQERKAALAPDKEKIIAFAGKIASIEMPDVKSEEAMLILSRTQTLLNEINSYLLEKSDTL